MFCVSSLPRRSARRSLVEANGTRPVSRSLCLPVPVLPPLRLQLRRRCSIRTLWTSSSDRSSRLMPSGHDSNGGLPQVFLLKCLHGHCLQSVPRLPAPFPNLKTPTVLASAAAIQAQKETTARKNSSHDFLKQCQGASKALSGSILLIFCSPCVRILIALAFVYVDTILLSYPGSQ